MSNFINEINKVLNKKADGVKTISERVLPVDVNPDSPVRPELKNQSRLTPRPEPFTPNRQNMNPTTARIAASAASRVARQSGTEPPDDGMDSTYGVRPPSRINSSQASAATSSFPEPRIVRTVQVRPDGTIVQPQAAGPAPSPAPSPNLDPDAAFSASDPRVEPQVAARATAGLSANRSDSPRERNATASAAPAAPQPAPRPAPSPNLDPHAKSKAMFQAYSDKGDDATSADFFAADRQRTAELRGMAKENFEQFVKSFVKEQNDAKKQWKREMSKLPLIDPKHAPTSPNARHMEEEQLDEIRGTATSFGGRHNPQRSTAKYLAGKRLQKRASLQRTGNQRRKPGIYEEIKEKFMRKLAEKQNEKELGSTDTKNKKGETFNPNPEIQDLTGPTR